ncbi:MAG: sensor histidine kinase [Suilimivivens sp.]
MIKKLQYRFILITMACIGFIFILILLALNISMSVSSQKRGYDVLMQYVSRMEYKADFSYTEHDNSSESISSPDRNAQAPETLPPFFKDNFKHNDWFNDMRIFSIVFDSTGQITDISTGENPNLTEDALTSMADTILKKEKEKGTISGYLYLCVPSETKTAIYFLDYTPEQIMSFQLLHVCLWVGLGGMLVIFILVIFLSRWVSKPVKLAFDNQKQFIADASHELKTPLTIITTNAELLRNSLPDNRWLNYILEQSGRMKELINSLLELARLDTGNERQIFHTFDISKAVRNAALSFESLAYEYEKKYTMEIEEHLSFCGNEEQIKQLVTILLDNAFKYSGEQGIISLSLSRHGDKKQLVVHNTGNGINEKEQKHIFERFYRSDASRSRESGGYGLGLSIAQSIVKIHKGQIRVKSDGKSYAEFSVLLP